MKKLVLLFTGVLMSLTTVTASDLITDKKGNHLDITKRYRYAQPIVFVERGVEFLIFPDGSFDFNTNLNNVFFRRGMYSRRESINTTYGHTGSRVKYSSPRHSGLRVAYNNYGQVQRIGNVYLNYNRHGKVKRIGSVYMDYKHGTLKQVGSLRVNYNHWGQIVHTRGQVSAFNDNCGICGISGCTTNHSHNNYAFNNNWENYDYNNDAYYYNQNGKKKKHKKRKR